MARAIIKGDIISKLVCDINLGIEIGKVPRNIGLSRLRWDGEKIVDLLDLTEFYVDRTDRKLHIKDTGNCDLVVMNYNQRTKLVKDPISNKLRVKTKIELEQPKKDEYKAFRKTEMPSVGDQLDAILKYLEKQNLTSEPELVAIIAQWRSAKESWVKPAVSEQELSRND